MTREELKEHCKKTVEQCEMWAIHRGEEPSGKVYEEHKLILDILEQEPCEDAISREALLKKQYRIDDSVTLSTRDVVNVGDIEDAPPVTPSINADAIHAVGYREGHKDARKEYSRPKGHWIKCKNDYECSECGGRSGWHYNYCHDCGTEMVEPQESEKINCKTVKCENCKNHNYCDYEPQESEV